MPKYKYSQTYIIPLPPSGDPSLWEAVLGANTQLPFPELYSSIPYPYIQFLQICQSIVQRMKAYRKVSDYTVEPVDILHSPLSLCCKQEKLMLFCRLRCESWNQCLQWFKNGLVLLQAMLINTNWGCNFF